MWLCDSKPGVGLKLGIHRKEYFSVTFSLKWFQLSVFLTFACWVIGECVTEEVISSLYICFWQLDCPEWGLSIYSDRCRERVGILGIGRDENVDWYWCHGWPAKERTRTECSFLGSLCFFRKALGWLCLTEQSRKQQSPYSAKRIASKKGLAGHSSRPEFKVQLFNMMAVYSWEY